MILDCDNWEFVGPGEGKLEETEREWKGLSPDVKQAVQEYINGMNQAFPGGRFGLKVIGSQVRVICFPPQDHPAYDPQNPRQGVVVTIGPGKGSQ